MKTIGIDIGTTTISLVVLDTERRCVLESRTISNGTFLETDQEWERMQDAEQIIQKAEKELSDLLETVSEIEGIGLTGQMHGIVYVSETGEGISPLYTWQDGRGDQSEFDGCSLVEEVARKTGISVASGFGLVTHLYLCRKGLVPKRAAAICSIADYLGMRLTGRTAPCVHVSQAASFGFFDLEAGCFQEKALKELGADTSLLPEITEEIKVLGTYRGIPVTAALGDNQASFLGAVGWKKQTVLLNMGTGGQISMLSERAYSGEGIEARPFLNGTYLLVGASLCGGRAYAMLEQFFRTIAKCVTGREESFYEQMEQLAEKGRKQKDGMRVHTCFRGTRVDPILRGSICNIGEDNFTPESLTYGMLEGMARELFELYEVMCKATGERAVSMVASGNGLRKNRILQEICAQMFEAEISLAAYEEEAACGAAVSCSLRR